MAEPLSQEVCDRIKRLREVHPQRAVAEIVGCAVETVRKIEQRGFKAGGGNRARALPLPQDYVIQAAVLTFDGLCAHYHVCTATVSRWNKLIRRKRLHGYHPLTKPVPPRDELEAKIKEVGVVLTAAHYGTSKNTLNKWRRLHGLPIRDDWKKALMPEVRIGWVERYVAEKRVGA